MFLKINRISLLILGITALVCSRVLFTFFNDQEGPNLLVIGVLALVIYLLSVVVLFKLPAGSRTKLQLAIFIQVAIVVGLYFALR